MTEKPEIEPDRVDALLDRALASYTPAAPRAGLEERIRARLAPSPARRRTWALWPALAAGAALAGVLAAALLLRSHSPALAPNLAQSHPAAVLAAPAAPRLVPSPRPHRPLRTYPVATPHMAPYQPTQRELIARLIARGPETIAALARAQAEDEQDKPITVQPISDESPVIEPIQIPPIDDNPDAPTGASKETQ
jgi:hypothetical protein